MQKRLVFWGVVALAATIVIVAYVSFSGEEKAMPREPQKERLTIKQDEAKPITQLPALPRPSKTAVKDTPKPPVEAKKPAPPKFDYGEKMAAYKTAMVAKEWTKARDLCLELLRSPFSEKDKDVLTEQLGQITRHLVKPRPLRPATPTLQAYTIQPGDTLSRIGKRFHVPYGLIMRLNALTDTAIFPGDQVKVIPGPFHILIDRKKFRLHVLWRGGIYKSFPVGLGKTTPTGAYHVASKIVDPPWIHQGEVIPFGDPRHEIGTRWIGFHGRYGIHGTRDKDSIGRNVSRGCVRLLNEQVEEVFDLVIRRESKITVR